MQQDYLSLKRMPEFNPDYRVKYLGRVRRARRIRDDDSYRKAVLIIYKNDPVAWINDWCVTYDPRAKAPKPKTMPFILFPKQEEFVEFLWECLKTGEDGLVEKSRDMGATWVSCAFSIWLYLFQPQTAISWGSRKRDYVDMLGNPDSIFEKMRIILRNLPSFMLPNGFNMQLHAKQMAITNPVNSSTVTGESGDQIGRGGRSTIYFKDESAWYERPIGIEAALGDNTDVQIDMSSVSGTNNPFYRRRMAGEIWEKGKEIKSGITRVFIMDWRDHPHKTQAWYDRRRAKAEREGMLHVLAQEVDRNYSASLDRIIIPQEWVKAAIDAHIKLKWSVDGMKSSGMDVADEGGDKHALAQKEGVILRECYAWAEGDTGDATRKVVRDMKVFGSTELHYDSIGVGAGVKSETNRLKSEGALDKIKVHKWNAGASPIEPEKNIILNDRESPKNKDYFISLRVQAWWRLSRRFYKTYRAVTKGDEYPEEELISIDSGIEHLHDLCMELSQVTQDTNGKGKMVIDKKPDGAKSPNLADAVVICYCPNRKLTGFDVL